VEGSGVGGRSWMVGLEWEAAELARRRSPEHPSWADHHGLSALGQAWHLGKTLVG
jgi:hypothetical protein